MLLVVLVLFLGIFVLILWLDILFLLVAFEESLPLLLDFGGSAFGLQDLFCLDLLHLGWSSLPSHERRDQDEHLLLFELVLLQGFQGQLVVVGVS